jgi:peroxiredoxin
MRDMRELEPQRIGMDGETAWTFDRMPKVGERAPGFCLCDGDFRERTDVELAGREWVLHTAPTFEEGEGIETARRLADLTEKSGVAVVNVSTDSPWALRRIEAREGKREGVVWLSCFRSPEFGMAYGTLVAEGRKMGVMAAGTVVVGADGVVKASELAGSGEKKD